MGACHFIPAYDNHDAQWLDVFAPKQLAGPVSRIERGPVGLALVGVAKDAIRVHKRVEIPDADVMALGSGVERDEGQRVGAGAAAAVVAGAIALLAVTVDVHVAQLTAGHLPVDDSVLVKHVAAVRAGCQGGTARKTRPELEPLAECPASEGGGGDGYAETLLAGLASLTRKPLASFL